MKQGWKDAREKKALRGSCSEVGISFVFEFTWDGIACKDTTKCEAVAKRKTEEGGKSCTTLYCVPGTEQEGVRKEKVSHKDVPLLYSHSLWLPYVF